MVKKKNVTKKTLMRTLQTRMAKIFIAACTFYRIRFIDIVEQQLFIELIKEKCI